MKPPIATINKTDWPTSNNKNPAVPGAANNSGQGGDTPLWLSYLRNHL